MKKAAVNTNEEQDATKVSCIKKCLIDTSKFLPASAKACLSISKSAVEHYMAYLKSCGLFGKTNLLTNKPFCYEVAYYSSKEKISLLHPNREMEPEVVEVVSLGEKGVEHYEKTHDGRLKIISVSDDGSAETVYRSHLVKVLEVKKRERYAAFAYERKHIIIDLDGFSLPGDEATERELQTIMKDSDNYSKYFNFTTTDGKHVILTGAQCGQWLELIYQEIRTLTSRYRNYWTDKYNDIQNRSNNLDLLNNLGEARYNKEMKELQANDPSLTFVPFKDLPPSVRVKYSRTAANAGDSEELPPLLSPAPSEPTEIRAARIPTAIVECFKKLRKNRHAYSTSTTNKLQRI